MIKVVIIEDEIPARRKLKRFLDETDSTIQIMAEIDTVAKGISFLKSNQPDLILSDIELLDGNSFEIFSQVPVTCPIIFTTAYDQFLMDAFESNGIAYLMKPFTMERFQKAWDKFLLFRTAPADADGLVGSLTKMIEQTLLKKPFKKRFSVHNHQAIYFLETEKICFFEANDGLIFAHDITGKKHILTESTLKELEELLDPDDFFRINRSELVNKQHIEKIETYTKNTLSVKLKGSQKSLLTSQQNTASFRSWIHR
ncbi:MAG: response regulator transcription factor [Bacteroidetes bacterium]|nr:response regulator transcription factor [Bacteroidota bacterium]